MFLISASLQLSETRAFVDDLWTGGLLKLFISKNLLSLKHFIRIYSGAEILLDIVLIHFSLSPRDMMREGCNYTFCLFGF